MPISKRWVLSSKRVSGIPEESDFSLEEDQTADLRKGEILCRALFLSVDPIYRLNMAYAMDVGEIMPGRQVARVVESKNGEFPKGKLVVGSLGWQTYSVCDPESRQSIYEDSVPLVTPLPPQLDSSGLPKSACLGVLGVPGVSAYLSLMEKCKVKCGETLVVSSAAGQIGHLAGQIAKFLGLKVIGYTGDPDKASWIKTELGFDWAFNYKTQDVVQTLKISAPNGVDVFLDSVGGAFHNTVLAHMAQNGRVCIFGNLSVYNNPRDIPLVPSHDLAVALKGLSIMGFNALGHPDRREEALDQLSDWCRDGYIDPYEHSVEGFENLPTAFIDMLNGKSQGKVIVRV